jgi:hypothetical protein
VATGAGCLAPHIESSGFSQGLPEGPPPRALDGFRTAQTLTGVLGAQTDILGQQDEANRRIEEATRPPEDQ